MFKTCFAWFPTWRQCWTQLWLDWSDISEQELYCVELPQGFTLSCKWCNAKLTCSTISNVTAQCDIWNKSKVLSIYLLLYDFNFKLLLYILSSSACVCDSSRSDPPLLILVTGWQRQQSQHSCCIATLCDLWWHHLRHSLYFGAVSVEQYILL